MKSVLQDSRVLTLVFTDLAESTALKSARGDLVVGDLITRHRDHVTGLAEAHGGRIVSWAGDGCFLTFETPSAAVQFALRLQEVHFQDDQLPKVRIGAHMGEVSDTPVHGSAPRVEGLAVDFAARVSSLAIPGQILLSSAVFDSARQRLSAGELDGTVAWRAHGAYELKGLDGPVEICEVGNANIAPLTPPAGSDKAHRAVTPSEEETLGWRPAIGHSVPGRSHWKLTEQLGVGGFGEVWLATHDATHAKRVFKFCFQPDLVRSLKREVVIFRLLKETLGERDDIARILDWDFEKPPYFLEAEYTEGGDLRQWCERHGGLQNLRLDTKLEFAAQVADALDAAHSAGVLHKDLKPTNILISDINGQRRARLTDFGIGLLTDPEALKNQGITAAGLTKTLSPSSGNTTSGTGMYTAPEIFEGKPPSEKSDLYALGVVLYQMVIGDFSRSIAPGWERDVPDEHLREDIAACVDGQPENRPARAGVVAERLRAIAERRRTVLAGERRRRRRKQFIAGAAAIVLLGLAIVALSVASDSRERGAKERWARQQAIPQIMELLDEEQYGAAFALANEVAEVLPADSVLAQLIDNASQPMSITTAPLGARAFYKPYNDIDGEWRLLGTTPLTVNVPFGAVRWRTELDGYAPVVSAGYVSPHTAEIKRLSEDSPYLSSMMTVQHTHPRNDGPLAGMRVIEGGPYSMPIAEFAPLQMQHITPFAVDLTEVTNADFKQFLDAGGYTNPVYWQHPFEKNGERLSFEQAMAILVDQTARLGPAGWQLGNFPKGQDNYPVGGVSWYEAAAYAEFRGKSLPTIFHWTRAAMWNVEALSPLSPAIIQHSNFGGEGPQPVGTNPGIGSSGAYDMAGNVREWVSTEAGNNRRYSLGGGWSDPDYFFMHSLKLSPWERAPENGFRCVKYSDEEPPPEALLAKVILPETDFYAVQPFTDEAFAALTKPFQYDQSAPLNPQVEEQNESTFKGRHETVGLNAAYGNERFSVHLFWPEQGSPPYDVVVAYPGMAATQRIPFGEDFTIGILDFVVQSNRVLVVPEYAGLWSRSDGSTLATLMNPSTGLGLLLKMSQDMSRTIDYLETVEDLDTGKIAYFGVSLGAAVGSCLLPLEDRIDVAVFMSGGFASAVQPPFARRVTQPTLVINGNYDYVFPVETKQKPLFDLLGTPPEHKRHVVLEGGHIPPMADVIRESLTWLDRYQSR